MKRNLLFFLTLLLILTAQAGGIDHGYHIEDWTYEAQVHEDNTWTVTETMTVEFHEQRHGIYRHIPRVFVRHHDAMGEDRKYTYRCEIEDARVDSHEYKLDDADNDQQSLIIRIGSEDRLVSGRQSYVIHYTIDYPDDRYTSADELIHTVLGTECNTNIEHFRFDIKFDKSLPSGLALKTMSGDWGGEGNKLNVVPIVTANSISGEATQIAPFCGITLQAPLPEGFWKGAKTVSPILAYIFAGLFLLFMVICLVYELLHRRKRPLMVIEYNAPDDICSAEVGVIIDDSADVSDLTSLIVWWASKGYLKMRETHTDSGKVDMRLTVLKPLEKDAPEYQQIFWNVFFEKKNAVSLSELGDKHQEIYNAQIALAQYFSGERQVTSTNWKMVIVTFIMYLCGFLLFAYGSRITTWYEKDLAYASFGFSGLAFVAMSLRMWFSSWDMIRSRKRVFIQYAAILILALISLSGFNRIYNASDYLLPQSLLNTIIGSGWLVALLSGRLARDTEYRKEKMSLLLGFREFIRKAELPMLKAQVDENPEYFYDVLPYAMVFGLTNKWQKHFKNMDIPAPSWYESTGGNQRFSSYMLADRISHSVNHTIRQAVETSSHDPNSSSSGSSFSGGGGGGGGVGSW